MRAREDELRQKKETARKERKVTIDLVNRRAVDEAQQIVDVYEEARLAEDRRAVEAAAVAAETSAAPVGQVAEGGLRGGERDDVER